MARYEWTEGIQMAREIIERHPEVFRNVPALSDILFVMDDENTPKSKGQPVLARVSKIAGKVVDFIDAEQGVHRLRGHDVEEFMLILNRFGPNWNSPTRGDVENILAPGFSWGVTGQSRLRFDQPTVQHVADGVAAAVPGTQVGA